MKREQIQFSDRFENCEDEQPDEAGDGAEANDKCLSSRWSAEN